MYEDNLEYAEGRLRHTVVMLRGEPVFIRDIVSGDEVFFSYLKEMEETYECSLSDLDVFGQNKLGYVNYGDSAYHLVRKPVRNDWRQGIRMANLTFTGEEGFGNLPWLPLRNTILGSYPNFEEAVKVVERGHFKCAFSRNFAVGMHHTLFYKERPVGSYDKIVTLREQFKYLTEYLHEVLEGEHA